MKDPNLGWHNGLFITWRALKSYRNIDDHPAIKGMTEAGLTRTWVIHPAKPKDFHLRMAWKNGIDYLFITPMNPGARLWLEVNGMHPATPY